jgi:thiosulfate/3-mercaptopyruvate sulfurtransferase
MAYSTLISTDALAAHLVSSWVVVDCRYDLKDELWGVTHYRVAHIPGAVYASLSHDLAATPTGANGRHPIPPIAAIEATFGRLGIGPGVQVVLYDHDTGMFASRMWWMLRYLGHDAAAVLDGGWSKWVREGRATRTGDEHRAPAAFVARPRADWRVDVSDVERALGGIPLLVDARAPERFEGRSEPLDRKAGHIPGAVNHFYQSTLAQDGTLLPVAQLRKQFSELLGDRTPDQVVMYCGSGVSACVNVLAMEHAGLHGAKLYPGSWSEWSSEPGRPVATGKP